MSGALLYEDEFKNGLQYALKTEGQKIIQEALRMVNMSSGNASQRNDKGCEEKCKDANVASQFMFMKSQRTTTTSMKVGGPITQVLCLNAGEEVIALTGTRQERE